MREKHTSGVSEHRAVSRDETRTVDEAPWVDRALDDDLPGSAPGSRVVGALAAAGIAAAMALALNGDGRSDEAAAGRGSSATASRSVTAGAELAERSRAVPSTILQSGEAGVSKRAGRGRSSTGPGSKNPGSENPDAPPLASATPPVVGEVTVPQPEPELPPMELPPVEPPRVRPPQLPQLLPSDRQQ
jgi:hypothetical protein